MVTSSIGFESAVETTFPMNEAYSASFLCISFNAFALLLTLLAPSLPPQVVNGALAMGASVGAILICFFDPPSKRKKLDDEALPATDALYQFLE